MAQPLETFRTLIDRNKRNSVILIAVFMLFFIAVGYLIGWAWGGTDAFGVVVAVGAGTLAFILTLASYYGGSSALLSMSSARQIAKGDDPQLFNVVEELSVAAGLPMPRVYLIDDSAMNAFATGRDPAHAAVAITTGLREKLTREELQGVLAHELSHVRNYDIRYAMLMAVMVGVLVMLCDVFLRSLWYGGRGRRRSDSRDSGGGGAQIILLILALVLAIVAPILAKIIEMALSRQREYMADAGSVELTRNARGLESALAKLSDDPEVLEVANRATAPLYIVHPIKHFEDRASSIFDSHPPIADRIRRLQSLE
ncbi:MAG: M48 family metallopeptidase [Planctomycetaceae bacterium]|nr:M48 family metallopeptidase [Planctomycetaceae bacterium]